MSPMPELGRHLHQRLAHLHGMGAGFQRAGSGDQRQRPVIADGEIADGDMARLGRGYGVHGLFIAEVLPGCLLDECCKCIAPIGPKPCSLAFPRMRE